MKKLFVLAVAAMVCGAWVTFAQVPAAPETPKAAPEAAGRSKYGGCLEVQGEKTGFFHTQRIGGRWWLVDPDGLGYLGCGMVNLGYYPGAGTGYGRGLGDETDKFYLEKYPTREQWRDAQLSRLLSWGFNFSQPDRMASDVAFRGTTQPAGPWMPYAFIVNAGGREVLADVFDDSFTQRVVTMAGRSCAPLKDNARLVGYFTGNELPWNMAWGGSHIENYIGLPVTAGGRKVAAEYLTKRYATVEEFNKAWDAKLGSLEELATGTVKAGARFDRIRMAADRDDFLFLMSKQFFGTLYREIKKADPNHMVLGSRFLTGDVSMAVARGMKGNVDVVSSNSYLMRRWPKFFDNLNKEVDAPVFVTEFGYRAYENGITVEENGAIPRVVQTDQDRADHYAWYVNNMAAVPYLVGTNWWWYPDGYAGVSGVGLGNYGFVSFKDEPYKALVAGATKANFDLYAAARKGQALVREPEVEYAVAKTAPLGIDGTAEKYGKLDINMDFHNGYEGYDFQKSGLAANATLRHDGKNIYLAIRVKDAGLKRYNVTEINAKIAAAAATRPAATAPATGTATATASRPAPVPPAEKGVGIWQIDGVEFWFGHYQGVMYFDGEKVKADIPSGMVPEMEVAGQIVEGGYFFEIKLPMVYLADAIKDGKVKLAVGVNDGERGIRMRQIYWPATYEWQYQDTFANGQLGQ